MSETKPFLKLTHEGAFAVLNAGVEKLSGDRTTAMYIRRG